MQTGFALYESGCGSLKNEANIMMKNAIDVLMGGFSYWLVGYGLREAVKIKLGFISFILQQPEHWTRFTTVDLF